ncbi:MAG TPA: M23 family peptidase, partial [Sphingobacteriaceae bacterium]|nr:M23 family peptidase [Sphingobacteriaceae bacterium]
LYEKALIRDTRGKAYLSSYENGYIKAMPGSFGSFYITIDTIAPIIRPVNLASGKSMAGISKMIFKISDSLSGIKSFKGTMDGNWILMEYDQKTATLWHTFDERTSSGKHTFQLEVTDNKLNTKTYTATLYR